FGPRRGNPRDQRRLSNIRISNQADIGEQLEFQPQSSFLSWTPLFVLARRLMRRGLELCVAAATTSATRNYDAIVRGRKIVDLLARFSVVDNRTNRNFQQ